MSEPLSSIPRDTLASMVAISPWAHAVFSGESLDLLHWNSAFAHWLDHKTGTLPSGLRIPDLLAPGSAAEFHRSILSHAKVFSSWEGVLVLRTLNGESLQAYACIVSFRSSTGEDLCLLTASATHLSAPSSEISNISDHELLHALLETVPMSIYFKDLKSRFIRASSYQAKRHDFADAAELVGLSDFDIFSLEHAQPAFASEQSIIATGQALIDIEERETYSNQEDTWVSTSKFPLTNRSGQVVGTFGLSKDITTQHNLLEKQARITEELTIQKDRNKHLSQLPKELQAQTRLALRDAQSIKASFDKLLPQLSAYHHFACDAAGNTDTRESLQHLVALEKALQPEAELKQITTTLERNIDVLLKLQTQLDGLQKLLAAEPHGH